LQIQGIEAQVVFTIGSFQAPSELAADHSGICGREDDGWHGGHGGCDEFTYDIVEPVNFDVRGEDLSG
jgi:hypothetical protein